MIYILLAVDLFNDEDAFVGIKIMYYNQVKGFNMKDIKTSRDGW
jgi:hypothetical protein